MPLYLVRWPGRVASLIKARDDDHLMDILDETGDPSGCTWAVYRGPVALDFVLRVPLVKPKDVEPGSPDDVASELGEDFEDFLENPIEIVRPGGDTDWDMMQAIFGDAFPDLYDAFTEAWDEAEGSGKPASKDMRKAAFYEFAKTFGPPPEPGGRRKGPIVRRAYPKRRTRPTAKD